MKNYVISGLKTLYSPRGEPLVYFATLICEDGNTEIVQLFSSPFGVWVYFMDDQIISLAEGEVADKALQDYLDGDKMQCTHSFEPRY